jgi:tetratricopeptide (TPR) repeat protein
VIDAIDIWTTDKAILCNGDRYCISRESGQLAEIACEVDDDPKRNEIRIALTSVDDGRLDVLRNLLDAPLDENAPVRTLRLLVNVAYTVDDDERAERLLAAAALLDPRDPWIRHEQAGDLQRHHPERMDARIGALQAAVAIRPDSAHLWHDLALAFLDRDDAQSALSAARQSTRCDPKSVQGWRTVGEALGKLGRNDEATAAFNEALSHGPEAGGSWLEYGMTLRAVKKFKEADPALQRALALDPESSIIEHEISKVKHGLGDLDGAIQHERRAVSLDPGDVRWRKHLARLLYEARDWQKVIETLQVVVSAGSASDDDLMLLAGTARQAGDVTSALHWVREGLRQSPGNQYLLANEVLYLGDLGQLDLALGLTKVLAEHFPRELCFRELQGRFLRLLGRPGEAVKQLRSLEEECSQDASFRIELGSALADAGDRLAAVRQERIAASLDPTRPEPLILMAEQFMGVGDLDGGIAMCRAAIRVDARVSSAWNDFGKCQFMLGDEEGAEQSFRKALELNPDEPVEIEFGGALMSAGRPDEAMALLISEKCVRLESERAERIVEACGTMLELAKALDSPAKDSASDASDRVVLAVLHAARGEYKAAVDMFQDAFTNDPLALGSFDGHARIFAARAAAKAGEWVRCVTWLEEELEEMRADSAAHRFARCAILCQWQGDAVLAPIRDPDHVEKLEPELRGRVERLWKDVDEFVRQEASARAESELWKAAGLTWTK